MSKVKITDGGAEYPFIRMENVYKPLDQLYVYDDGGEEKTIPVNEATIVPDA